MATRKQIAANRRNAERSTGPRSPEGKAASRFNALKTGLDAKSLLLPHESADDLAALTQEYYARFAPAVPEARALVDALISSEWQMRRLRHVETDLWAYLIDLFHDDSEPDPHLTGHILDSRAEVFARLQRRIDSAQRNYLRALKELRTLPPAEDDESAEPDSAPALNSEPAALAEPSGAGLQACGRRPRRPTAPPPPQPPLPQPLPPPIPQIGFVPQSRGGAPIYAARNLTTPQ